MNVYSLNACIFGDVGGNIEIIVSLKETFTPATHLGGDTAY
jgi:hypothetical protein